MHSDRKLQNYSFLVTGGAGFIGSNLVKYLIKNGAGKVSVLDNLETGFLENIEEFIQHPSFTFRKGEITDLQTCLESTSEVDIVFHEAALGSVPRSIKDPLATNHTNVNGFLNMLFAAKENKVGRFIYAASSSAYGDSQVLPKKEENTGKPLSPYAVTKVVNEMYAEVFGKTYRMETIGLRYFNVFGPKQNPEGAYAAVIPRFIQKILRGEAPVIEGDGSQTRDFTYVDNVIQANIKAALTTNPQAINQIFNIAVGERTSLLELCENLKKLSGNKINPVFSPPRKGDIKDSLAEISKARDLLDYKPIIHFHEGLQTTFNWFKNRYEQEKVS